MAIQSDRDKEQKDAESAEGDAAPAAPIEPVAPGIVVVESGDDGGEGPVQLGVQRYVHAAFFVAAILVAYLSGKLLTSAWNALADWATAVRAIPQLVNYPEDQRESLMLVAGAVIALVSVIQVYRKQTIRTWADEVAGELSRVTWPNRETVVNGTLVVIIASTIATVYVAILDRFWGFLTNLVYGSA